MPGGNPGGRKPGGGPCMLGGPKPNPPGGAGGIIPMPRPAGMPRPGPTGKADFLSSSTTGGGPSTLRLTTVSPRKITRPSVRFISCMAGVSVSPGFFFGLTLLNSSQSARTRFMCRSNASILPTKERPSLIVIFIRQLIRPSIFPPLAFGGGMVA